MRKRKKSRGASDAVIICPRPLGDGVVRDMKAITDSILGAVFDEEIESSVARKVVEHFRLCC